MIKSVKQFKIDISTNLRNNYYIGEVKAIYECKTKMSEIPKILNSKDIFDYIIKIYNKDIINYYECFYVIFLNRANKIIAHQMISQGGISGTVVDIRFIIATSSILAASSIILIHNHPSGNLTPSHKDLELTKEIKVILKTLNINLIDHLIITEDTYLSFSDECLF